MNFKTISLSELVDFKNGKKNSDRNPDGSYELYGSNGVIDRTDKFNADENCLVIGRVGAYCGSVYFPKKKSWVSDNAIIGVPKTNADPNFLYYLLEELKLNNMASGSAQPLINQAILNSINVKIPPIELQKKIGGILSIIDEKIHFNNELIINFEKVNQLLFENWFIDFNFPNEEGHPYKFSGGDMVETELGTIPEGWRYSSLEDLVDETIGGDWGKEYPQGNYEEKVHVVRGADLTNLNLGIYTKIPERYILPKNYQNKKLKNLDMIIEISGGSPTQSTGRISLITDNIINKYNDKLISTNFCRIIRLRDVKQSMFFLNWWKFFYEKDIFFQYENGTTGIKNLDLKSFLKNNIVAIPISSLIEKFNQINASILNNIFSLSEENIKLSQLRDILRPKLLSGELEILLKSEQFLTVTRN